MQDPEGAASDFALAAPPRNVLLVEDDPDLQEVLSDLLSEFGHHVVIARNGVEGLRVLATFRPDVVLLDLFMPKMDGWGFRAEQRRDPALAEIPVIAMSASHTWVAGLADVDLYLSKPFRVHDILCAVARVTLVAEQRRAARSP
jgi:CheY-like chemotaxis protein